MSNGVILIIVIVLLLLVVLYFVLKKKKLTPATSLRTQHLESLENNMERYRLFWTQSTATTANTQDVVAVINSGSEQVIENDLLMTSSEFIGDFPTGATVAWKVRTYNADKSEFIDSVTDAFVATNQEPLTAATGLGHEWIAHVA